jgi:hypothetical protein
VTAVGSPAEQILLINGKGESLDVDDLVDELRMQPERVLVDDEVGVVIFVGDLEIFTLAPTDTGEFLAQPVKEISRARFSTRMLRKQIGPTVLSVTADAVFVVRDGNTLRKVRAEKLEPGMVLATGHKVYR